MDEVIDLNRDNAHECAFCEVITWEWDFIAGRYWCKDHIPQGRQLRGNLDRSRALMGNKNAAKKKDD